MQELAGRVAVITGAAGGIGLGIAGALAAQGMRIVAADRDAARLAVAGAQLRCCGAEVIEQVTDVRNPAAVHALVCPGKVRTSILDHISQRPESADPPELSPQAQSVLSTMRNADVAAMSAEQAGLSVCDVIIQNRFWVLVGADAHRPLVQQDTQELLDTFG